MTPKPITPAFTWINAWTHPTPEYPAAWGMGHGCAEGLFRAVVGYPMFNQDVGLRNIPVAWHDVGMMWVRRLSR